jgi:hypothetical protein
VDACLGWALVASEWPPPHTPGVARPIIDELAGPGTTLAAGVTGGFVAGLLIGGVGGRLAMLILRLTSPSTLRGVSTDDGFTIGRVSAQTIFLLRVTAGLGIAGGVLYVVVRWWIPVAWRVPTMTVFFGLVGSSGIIGPDGLDFSALSPLPLAIAMFVAIPTLYGAAMPLIVERLLQDGSILRRRPRGWLFGLAPLLLLNVVGLLLLLAALGIRALGRANPRLVDAWRSPQVAWLGRAALLVGAVVSGVGLVLDAAEILG